MSLACSGQVVFVIAVCELCSLMWWRCGAVRGDSLTTKGSVFPFTCSLPVTVTEGRMVLEPLYRSVNSNMQNSCCIISTVNRVLLYSINDDG